MLKSPLKSLLLVSVLTSLPSANAAVAPVSDATIESSQPAVDGYVKDDLFIFLHGGPSKKFKILGSIKAGSPLTLLDTDESTGFIKVKDDRARIGWIENKSYSNELPMQLKLNALQTKLDQLVESGEYDESSINDLTLKLKAATKSNEGLNKEVAGLKIKLTALQAALGKTSDKKEQTQMIYGASICALGILFGLLMPSLVRRRRRADNWV